MHPTSTTAVASRPDSVIQNRVLSLLLSVLPFLVHAPISAQAPSLGSADIFAVLGASTVTNIGPSAIMGDVGVWPGTTITGLPPGTVTGTVHAGGLVAVQARADVSIAYIALEFAACTTTLTGQNLGGLTLTPGVYCFATSAQLTGALTLDALGSSSAVFIFQIGSTLTTASGSSVNLVNGASACRVFWQIGSSATLGTTTAFAGTMVALASITMATGATVTGRALALTGAVTMDTNNVVSPSIARWSNYGVGWPGTAGIPSLGLSARPVIGTTLNMVVQNVYGPPTDGFLLWGFGPANTPTMYGGSVQVQQVCGFSIGTIGPGLHAMPIPIPLDVQLICVEFYVQILQVDWNASHNVAFTRGLHMVLGL